MISESQWAKGGNLPQRGVGRRRGDNRLRSNLGSGYTPGPNDELIESGTFEGHDSNMSGSEVRRLDEKIEAANAAAIERARAADDLWNERFQRSREAAKADLDLALSKIDARCDRIDETMVGIKTEIHETRSAIANMKVVTITTGIAAVLTILFGVVGAQIGIEQVRVGWLQIGQNAPTHQDAQAHK